MIVCPVSAQCMILINAMSLLSDITCAFFLSIALYKDSMRIFVHDSDDVTCFYIVCYFLKVPSINIALIFYVS